MYLRAWLGYNFSMDQSPEQPEEEKDKIFSAWGLAWELGYTISIPIILLALLGRLGDKTFGTSPFLLLAGILLSILLSSYLIYRKVVKIL